jgi:hypothetical protein
MTGTFEAVWPIIDQDRTLAELVHEAQDDLPGLMVKAAVSRYGPGTWGVRDGAEMPGWGAYELVLVFSGPAEFFGGRGVTAAQYRNAMNV